MINKYPKYKSIKLQWFGNIPNHWNLISLKNLLEKVYGGGTPNTSIQEFWAEDNDPNSIPWVAISDITKSNGTLAATSKRITEAGRNDKGLEILPKGTLLMSIFASLGKTTILDIDATINQAILGLVPSKKLNLDFLEYLLVDAERYVSYFSSASTQENLNLTKIRNLRFPIPSIEEQTKIGQYLDHQTSIIDQLIQQKEKLIELLKEKRQAVINEAVTKGLNPNAKKKDSGIEWLGEVPEHWDILKLTWITDFITCGIASTPEYVSEDVGVPFLSAQNVKPDRIVLNKFKFISKELHAQLTKLRKPQKGDLLVTRVGAGIGEAAIVDIDFEFSVYVSLTHIRTNIKCVNKFLMYFFSTDYARKLASDGTVEGGGQGNLNVKNVEAYRIGVPPINEQNEILEYIGIRCNAINELIEKNEVILLKLKEYRQSTISEAVTGKIDVRDWQPKNNK